jgi:hypothetical protein
LTRSVNCQCAGAFPGFHCLSNFELARLVARNRERAISTTYKYVTIRKRSSVNAGADGKRAFNLAVLRVHHDELLWIPTAYEQLVSTRVQCYSNRMSSGQNAACALAASAAAHVRVLMSV